MGMTRNQQKPETMYVVQDGKAFFTPDGVGRIWYDSLAKAQQEHGADVMVVMLAEKPEDY